MILKKVRIEKKSDVHDLFKSFPQLKQQMMFVGIILSKLSGAVDTKIQISICIIYPPEFKNVAKIWRSLNSNISSVEQKKVGLMWNR